MHQEDWRGTFLGLLLFLAFLRVPARGVVALTGLGTISYSLYLFHPAVFYPMFRFVASRPAWSEAPLWTYVVASMAASIACAALSYRLIEAPCNRLARRWIERIGPIADRTAVPVAYRAKSR